MRGSGQRRWTAAVLFGFLAASRVAGAQQQAAPAPDAREAQDLEAARKLFAQSLREEQESRFAVALDGFRRVQRVRETASVDYHIGVCLEGLGQLADAVSTYRAAARLGEGDRAAGDVTAASHERIEVLSKQVAVVTLMVSSEAPAAADVRIDGAPVASRGDVVLDPGHHHVRATAPGAATFETDISLPAGGRASLHLPLDPVGGGARAHAAAPPDSTRPGEHGAPSPAAWIAVGAGTVLLAGSISSLVLRESDIAQANRICPGGACVGSIDPDALAATDRARVEGPLGWTLGAAALAVFAVGGYLFAHEARAVVFTATCGPGTASVELRGSL